MGALLRSARFHAILLSEDVAYEAKDKLIIAFLTVLLLPIILGSA
mgnify:CR=1 FL=1